jgi:hypothetical protein
MKPRIRFDFVHKDRVASITPENGSDEIITKMMRRPISSLDFVNLHKMGFSLDIHPEEESNEKSIIKFRAAESYENVLLVSSSEEADALFSLINRLSITPDEMLMLLERGFTLHIEGKIRDIVSLLKEKKIHFSKQEHTIIIE